MSDALDETLNIADWFLEARLREGCGDRTAILCGERSLTYAEVAADSHRVGNALRALGVEPEQRVIIALPDGPEYVAALFGVLAIGAVVVMVNPQLGAEEIAHFTAYSRAKVAVVYADQLAAFRAAQAETGYPGELMVVGGDDDTCAYEALTSAVSDRLEVFPTHPDDPAIWLFSGGTTGRPKAVVQPHRSFRNSTELYAKGVLGYSADDVTLSVPKLFFGYATGANLLFPFAVGATCILFPGRCTATALYELIARHRPTILINVPTMVGKLLDDPTADEQDLSCLRLSTSAGEALPAELHARWRERTGVDLLDGLGTAEMWHVFITNRPGAARPGTLGQVVAGFEVRVCDDDGRELPAGEVGWLHVRGDSQASGYWQHSAKTRAAFRGDWYVSGDMISMDADGYVTYCGRGDDMLKVGGKWLAPGDVENCLLTHPAVAECAVIGVQDDKGLVKPWAFVVPSGADTSDEVGEALKQYVRDELAPYKAPRQVRFLDAFPQTHLGKVDRGKLRALASG
jgi:benzoate-CoA ligase family protein